MNYVRAFRTIFFCFPLAFAGSLWRQLFRRTVAVRAQRVELLLSPRFHRGQGNRAANSNRHRPGDSLHCEPRITGGSERERREWNDHGHADRSRGASHLYRYRQQFGRIDDGERRDLGQSHCTHGCLCQPGVFFHGWRDCGPHQAHGERWLGDVVGHIADAAGGS
jgi:hypothetical protein